MNGFLVNKSFEPEMKVKTFCKQTLKKKLTFSTKKQEWLKILADGQERPKILADKLFLLDFFRFTVIILHCKRKLGSKRLNIQMTNS